MKLQYQLLTNWKYRTVGPCMVKTGILDLFINTPYATLHGTGLLIISDGYAWDGASGPAIDTKTFMRGSLVHDCLYQLMREGLLDRDKYRNCADELLRQICLEDGMWKARADWVYWAVKSFAKRSTEPKENTGHEIVTIE
jgi:hypothetical protein